MHNFLGKQFLNQHKARTASSEEQFCWD